MNLLSALSLPGGRLGGNIAYRSITQFEDGEVPSHHREGDVVDGHSADEPFVGACVAMAVQDEVRAVLGDRTPEAVAAEKRPDSGRFAFDRGRRRRVVEEHDADRAAGDGVEPPLERLDLVGCLGVGRAHDRFPEVG